MTGTATRTFGSDQQSGTVILQASANGQSQMELDLANGKLIETQSASTGFEGQCAQIGFDGIAHAAASHNCWRGTIWFLPQITLQSGVGWADNVVSAVAVPDGTSTLHCFRRPTGTMSDETANEIARISGFDLKLDASGHPVSLKFNAHPDDNPLIDLPTEIQFSDYRLVSGASVPFHIQKFINNGLVLDLQISSAQINPVLTGAFVASLQ
ncbi:MAG: hypothetical protein WA672_12535 [Candidatus Angelobacter sp.]